MTHIGKVIDRILDVLFPEPPEELDQEILARLRSRLNRPARGFPINAPGEMETPAWEQKR